MTNAYAVLILTIFAVSALTISPVRPVHMFTGTLVKELVETSDPVPGDPGLMPNKTLTPGAIDPRVTQANIEQTICVPGYTATVRNVTVATKRKVFEEYGLDYANHSGDYEVDHFVSLEIGGLNDLSNLWPQRYAPKPGAREKDVVETHLHRVICKGQMSLSAAQAIIMNDWYGCYQKIKSGTECVP